MRETPHPSLPLKEGEKKEIESKTEINKRRFAKFKVNLFILRCGKMLSQKQASLDCGFVPSRFDQLEYGRGFPQLDELIIISQFFEVTIDDLLFKNFKIIFE